MRSLVLGLLALTTLAAQTPLELVRVVAGPSGRLAGDNFVIDTPRTTFRYPADKELVIYFEWKAKPGKYLLTGVWKRPDGRPASLSDINLDTPTEKLQAYWTFALNPDMDPGIWELEVRINGARTGSQLFSVEMPPKAPPPAAAPAAPAKPQAQSLDQLYELRRSLVWVRKFDSTGRQIDVATGFVIAKDRIATAFQAVDGASRFVIERAPGITVEATELAAWNRLQDWAILVADTADAPPLPRAPKGEFKVGERVIVFNAEQPGTRQIGGVDITGTQDTPPFGERIQISPPPTHDATGGPVFNMIGQVIGIVGGTTRPGLRTWRNAEVPATLLFTTALNSAATPLWLVPDHALSRPPVNCQTLLSQRTFTQPIQIWESLSYAGTTNTLDKKSLVTPQGADTTTFRKTDPEILVYGYFRAVKKAEKLTLSAAIFDLANSPMARSAPTKLTTRQESITRAVFSFPPSRFAPGIYRVELHIDERPVWRSFITVTD